MRSLRRPRVSAPTLITILFIVACVLGIAIQRNTESQPEAPRAGFYDATPMGGKGLQLVLTRLGYTVRRVDSTLQKMPDDARVWILLDPRTRLKQAECKLLVDWVRDGGTLLWATAPREYDFWGSGSQAEDSASSRLGKLLNVSPEGRFSPANVPLPELTPLSLASASVYTNGVTKVQGSGDVLSINRPHLEIAGSVVGPELARLNIGKGRVFVTADALLWTNHALVRPDNATLVANLIGRHFNSNDKGVIYWDERNSVDINPITGSTRPATITDYLLRPPLLWALLQLLLGFLLWWGWTGRRLGTPVPLPEPVTRASQFAQGMGALFRKAGRSDAVAKALGVEFRRKVARRVGLSPDESDELLAARAAQITGYPAQMIDRLLLRAKAPAESEAAILSDTQEMEIVLRALRGE